MTEASNETGASRWLGYRPEIRVMDCTVRDGGLMNDHHFDDAFVKKIYEANVAAGVDIMELGYKGSKKILSPDKFGKWKFSTEEDIREIVGDNDTKMKISVMADAERCDMAADVLPKDESAIDIIRVATYIHQLPIAMDMVKDAHDKGYEVTINLMALSTVPEYELDKALETFANSPVSTIYIVDSFGSMYSEQVHYYINKFGSFAKPAGKELGMHAHNNQSLAYANTVECIINGVNLLDASMAGLGRGAGNGQMELLLGFLHNPKYHLRPLLKCIQEEVEPMRAKLNWGVDIPYMITGQLNQHPRAAMQFNESEDRGDYVKFFDMIKDD